MFPIRESLKYVEIETCNQCTRTCSWCLFGVKENDRGKLKLLDQQVIFNVFNGLKRIGFSGTVALYGINEPLLDWRITSGLLISKAREILGSEVCLSLTTNGDLLNLDVIRILFEAGLDSLSISCYEEDSLRKANKFAQNEQRIKVLDQRRYHDGLWESNRAGFLTKDTVKKYEGCTMPYFRTVIGWNGELRICPHEMTGVISIGNIYEKDFIDVLESERYELVRKKILTCRQEVCSCKQCNIDGSLKYAISHLNRKCEAKSIINLLKKVKKYD